MKNERGSALLTVILIVFVTTLIGTALSSFIMMNYKLRNLDNRISRAEYESEKNIDNIYMLVQKSVNDTIIDARNDAVNQISLYIQGEMREAEEELLAGATEYLGEYIYMQNSIIKSDEIAIQEAEERAYNNFCKANIYTNVRNKLRNEAPAELISSSEDFGKTTSLNEIKIKDNSHIDTDIITISLQSYYKIVSSPAVKFSLDFIISIPTYENIKSGNYNLNEIINMTNWEMQDWGYL